MWAHGLRAFSKQDFHPQVEETAEVLLFIFTPKAEFVLQ
jgi:hypothetical protein